MSSSRRIGALATLAACACALALAVVADARPNARASFRVTLTAQLTKTWDYVSAGQDGDCTVSTHVVGTRTITLRSSRPTIVTAIGSPGRMRFTPALLRSVTARTTQDGTVTVTQRGLGCVGRMHTDCTRQSRTLSNQTLRFFRSRPGEISFRRSRDYGAGLSRTCPPEDPEVQAERPGIHEAQGDLSERQLFDRGFRSQAVSGSFVEETDIDGGPDGKVVERVSWTLRFVRR
jgi:hypothetical protein